MDSSKIEICWHGDPCPDEYQDELMSDLVSLTKDLSSPSDLFFHTVILTPDYNGPTIIVWGEEDDDERFHCQYDEVTEWVSVEENPYEPKSSRELL